MKEKSQEALETIRPFLQRDGGDIQFIEYTDDHIVRVQLQGHCAGCPGATMTIKGRSSSEIIKAKKLSQQ